MVGKLVKTVPRVLVLAGLDPSGRAGLLADGEAVFTMGAKPVLCATAITAQSSKRMLCMEAVSVTALERQVAAALEDGEIAAIKLGMLGNKELLSQIVALLQGPLAQKPVVVDPVWQSSSAGKLFEGTPDDYWKLIQRADLITPNLQEASLLSGIAVRNEELMVEAANRLVLRGARQVLIKGGHLYGPPSDLLFEGGRVTWFREERINNCNRGTGCRLASGIAANLAAGIDLKESIERSREQVRKYIRNGC